MFLNEGYRVSISDRNVVLEKYIEPTEKTMRVDKDSPRIGTGEYTKGYYETLGYFPTYKAMLRFYLNLELRGVPQNFFELNRKLDEVYELIDGLEVEQ